MEEGEEERGDEVDEKSEDKRKVKERSDDIGGWELKRKK